MSATQSIQRKPTQSTENTEPAPPGVQTTLLPHQDSRDANRKERSFIPGQRAAHGESDASTGFHQSSRGGDKRRRCWQQMTTWWQEALAIVLLLGSLIASFATLYPYQDKPIPEWPYSITIGALLSIYSVILRLAATFLLSQGFAQSKWQWFNGGVRPLHDMVLHDNASRGPMGAFGLLYRLVFPITWQWLGCVLAIIALLVGPFTQQVLQYETCAVLDHSAEAFISRASAFMAQGPNTASGTSYLRAYLSFQEQASMLAGLYSPGAVVNSCSSGNCTFAPYTTVGYCSTCEDLSSQIRIERTGKDRPKINTTITSLYVEWNEDYSSYVSNQNRTLQVNYTNRDFPWDRNYLWEQQVATSAMLGTSYVVLMGIAERPWDRNTGSTPAECTDAAYEKSWRCQGYGAASCSINPCLRTYNSTVTNGILTEKLVGLDTEALKFSDGNWFDNFTFVQAALNLSCINDADRAVLRYRGYDLDLKGTWLSYNLTAWKLFRPQEFDPEVTTPMERGFVERGCLYVVPQEFTKYLRDFLRDVHSGDLVGMEHIGSQKAMIGINGSQILESVWNNGDFSLERTRSLHENMTLSITNYLRTNPGEPWRATHVREFGFQPDATKENDGNYYDATSLYLPAVGQAWTTKTCARIRWPWLVLPGFVTILTMIFYVGVIFSARALPKDVRTWKTSPLPFMFYGPGGSDDSQQQEWFKATSQHVDDMDAAARKIHLKLDHDEAGMAFFRKRGVVVDAERSSLTSGSDAVL